MKISKQKITPCLWFDNQAEGASAFYTSVFRNSRIKEISRYRKEGFEIHGKPEGAVMTVRFELENYEIVALNGGPNFRINPSVSFFITCETDLEVNDLWDKLSAGGETLMPLDKYDWSERYGWVQDRFGVSWQISLGKISDTGQKIVPCFLFVGSHLGQAREAVHRYTSLFENSDIDGILTEPGTERVLHSQFSLCGEKFMAMESDLDHQFSFNKAVSLIINCNTQEEVDHYWNALGEGGDPGARQCGWLKDKFGIYWQVIPEILPELLKDPDPEKAGRVTEVMLKMEKIEIEKLLYAYEPV
jgi:predicted 3-demethylubiquinone-9 3-methyltransferase (glyoxalase superfamily)